MVFWARIVPATPLPGVAEAVDGSTRTAARAARGTVIGLRMETAPGSGNQEKLPWPGVSVGAENRATTGSGGDRGGRGRFRAGARRGAGVRPQGGRAPRGGDRRARRNPRRDPGEGRRAGAV